MLPKKGHVDSQYNLAYNLDEAKNYREAKRWSQAAASQGDKDAKKMLLESRYQSARGGAGGRDPTHKDEGEALRRQIQRLDDKVEGLRVLAEGIRSGRVTSDWEGNKYYGDYQTPLPRRKRS